MLVRTDDPNDRRRVFAELSDYARKQMDELFSVVPPTETLI
jgi:DNA-binding MarR family transcriptional regulator